MTQTVPPLVAVAYLLLAYGLMQAISHCHRLMADSEGALRVWSAVSLLAALITGALHLTRAEGFSWLLIIAFAALGAGLAEIARRRPAHRFAPLSSLALIAGASIFLKASALTE
ncbi:MAG: hypothetical protein AAF568_07570 [Pseudomonadota bacterium]